MHYLLLSLHLLGAAVWTGGHLILALVILPRALRRGSPEELLRFEAGYERIGIPALLLQVITGLWLAYLWLPDPGAWFSLESAQSRLILTKLGLLAATLALAADARLRLIPRLAPDRLTALAWHIVPVTVLSVLFVPVGAAFRFGGWS